MKNFITILLALVLPFFASSCSSSSDIEPPPPAQGSVSSPEVKTQPKTESVKEADEDRSEGHSLGHKLIMYLPNRLLDFVDIARLRLRVGPGAAAGVRATKVAQAYVGTYVSVFAGLPGPRMRRIPKLPAGLESYNGIDLSLLEASTGGGIGPDYSPTEFGASAQLLLFGFDFGIDPVEILDALSGFVLIDLRDDDL